MRPIWTGSISFGLVNIPVRMYSGTNPRQGLDLDMLHKDDKSPIRFARICRHDGQEVPWEDIVKGYEYRDGDYVVLTKKELEQADAQKSETLDIQLFASTTEIDIRYYEKPYFLEPVKGGEKAYALLREALEQSGKLAIAKYVLHQREHLGAIQPVGRALVITQMRFMTDLREPVDLHLPGDTGVNKQELSMALKLINQETKPFIAEDYRDTYTEEQKEVLRPRRPLVALVRQAMERV